MKQNADIDIVKVLRDEINKRYAVNNNMHEFTKQDILKERTGAEWALRVIQSCLREK